MAKSLTWDRPAFARAPARRPRRRFANEAVAWQLASQRGGWAAFRSYADQSADRRARRKDPNRIVELHAMIGAIGEQAGLCWGFEQDAQRFDATRHKITKEHHRLVLRALSEAGGHFLLGAAHSLGNLGVRIALLDPQAGPAIQAARPKADFAPGSTTREHGCRSACRARFWTRPRAGLPTSPWRGSRLRLGAGSRPALRRPRLPAGHGLPPAPPAVCPARLPKARRLADRRRPCHDRSPWPRARSRSRRRPGLPTAHRGHGGGPAGHGDHPQRPGEGSARGRSLVPRTDAPADGCARQEGELTKLATKAGALADPRSPAGVGHPCTSRVPGGVGPSPLAAQSGRYHAVQCHR